MIKTHHHVYQQILEKKFPSVMEVPSTNDQCLEKQFWGIFWNVLARTKMQRSFKTYFKNILFERSVSVKDIEYIYSLVDSLDIPDYVNNKVVERYMEQKQFDFSFLSFVEHLVWYNLFFIDDNDKTLELL